MKKFKLVMVTIPEGRDELFDNFPPDTLYVSEVLSEEDIKNRQTMAEIGQSFGIGFYRALKSESRRRLLRYHA